MTKQLSDLKAGDQVILEGKTNVFTGVEEISLKLIARVSKTRITLTTKEKFRIEDGSEIYADPWSNRWIRPATPDLISKALQEKGLYELNNSEARALLGSLAHKCRHSTRLTAAIPHIRAALEALENDPDNNAT